MAGNQTSPSQAEQAAKSNKNKKNAADVMKKSAALSRTPPPSRFPGTSRLSRPWMGGLVCIVLAAILVGMAVSPEGMLVQLVRDLLMNLFGRGAVYLSIFGLLMLAFFHFRKTPGDLRARMLYMIAFVLLYGVLHHLIVNEQQLDEKWPETLLSFYENGVTGSSDGFICGTVAAVLRLLLGRGFAITVVIVVWGFVMLRFLDISLFELILTLREPDDPEDTDVPTGRYPDDESAGPSGAQRMASFMRNIRSRFSGFADRFRFNGDDDYFDDDEEDDVESDPKVTWNTPYPGGGKNGAASEKKKEKPQSAKKPQSSKDDILRQISGDFDEPVVSAGRTKQKSAAAAQADAEPAEAVRKVTAKEAAASAAQVSAEIARSQAAKKPVYSFPPIGLLKQPSRGSGDGTAEMQRNSEMLDEALASFKVDAHIVNVTRGPSVTRYEVELDKGVRLSKLTAVADDLALSLGVTSVRIAPVPGLISVVGIEVPNQAVTNVNLREVIDSKVFHRSPSKSTFAVGKDIGGNCIVGDIAKMPHMLIAGTTGSGKSVCMNSIIISLLYKASPEDVKLIMVDPKMVELGIYNDIPHLLIPVVTDPKKAAGSLQWAVTEMMRRYKLMSDAGVRDLESFNEECEEEESRMPQVVIIIDELADLMLVAAKEVEDSICRIAQMGRAAGMHLIIATQRPSADVITGLMKANIPSRIAFSVASAMESRIILDTQGAEKLVGKGDMLFSPVGTGKPQRVQGCFVSDQEVEAVASYVKENYKANYDAGVMEEIEKTPIHTGKKGAASDPEPNSDEAGGDEMLPAAVEVILETGQASVSMLQRRLKLGYARAARIVDEMEEKGIVGPFQGSKPRSILITKEQWEARKNGTVPVLPEEIPFTPDDPDPI